MGKKHKFIKRKHIGKKINAAADTIAANEPAKIKTMRRFVDRHKGMVLATFIIAVVVAIGTIWIYNYNTAYEYSYNGKTLGVVKDKEDVLKITNLVQSALTEERDVEVIIDQNDDIEFKRVAIIGSSLHVDTSEDVLRRMTYVGDINVVGYCITVDGKEAVVLDSEESANAVLDDIKDDFVTEKDNIIVESAEFQENIKIKQINTDLDNLNSKKEAKNILLHGGEVKTVHIAEKGDTFAAIAKANKVSEKELLAANPDVNPKALKEGNKITVIKPGAMVNMEVSKLVTVDEKIKHKVIEKKTDEMYEGDTEVKKEGKNGKRVVTSRIQTINGKEIANTAIVEIVKSKPVTEVLLVGTAERPPSIGDGKYRWPLDPGTYRISSEFGARWGRNHNGIDLACPTGTNVYAADGGIVTWAGYKGTFGNLVIINHQNGYETYYAHNSQLLVSVGDEVYEGMHIAESGNTGRSTGPHCHFEVRTGGVPYNPRNYLP
jgi:murein DD-endopeptidase MepM/ murein hydrolase activator NlpD